ncbi:MAG TPA: sensor histidine kinase [Nitrospirota bacterium]|nr:sensor histidine kinase [Nitrospirota bacterium]
MLPLRKSLKAKLFLIFFSLNLSVILLVGFISYQSKRGALKGQVENSLSIMSTELADKVDRFLGQRLADTRAIALHYSLHGLKTTTSGQNRILAQYLRIYPYYEHISLINISDVRVPTPSDIARADYGRNWYLPALEGRSVSSDMYVSTLTDRPTMSFAAPVRDHRGRVVSVVTTNLNLDYLWDLVDQVRKENEKGGLTGYAFLVNRDGLYIAHPAKEKVLTENPAKKDEAMRAMIREMTGGRSGTASYTYEGMMKVAAYAPCKGYGDYGGHGWSLAITKNYSEIFSPVKDLLRIYLALFFLTSLAAFFVAQQLTNYLVRPILALKDGVSKISSGNFSSKIRIKSHDEIGELAQSFNVMAETLEARDSQIKEYTWSLTRINRELALKQDELARANQFLTKTNEELVRLEKEKAEFNAMITHDIKSPLSTVITYAEMILDGTISGEDELKTALNSIHASGHKIFSLVDNFLVSSAIEAGKLRLNLHPLDVNELIDDELPFFMPLADKKKISISFNPGQGLPKVSADRVQLDRAITNIVNNALKYAPPMSEVGITTARDGDMVSISISDNGKGIPENEVDSIFKKYSRSKQTGKIDGLGLGLYISKAITEAHGGRIGVLSKPGEGCTFTISLPAAVQPEEGSRQ